MNPADAVLMIVVLALSISAHESSHAYVADECGDPTGRRQGRISMNPLDHVDPIGTIVFPAFLMLSGFPPFGWAKPVPVNPANLRNPDRDRALVSAAGPGANFLLAGFSILLYTVLAPLLSAGVLPAGEAIRKMLFYNTRINALLGVFNLIPVPPLDGGGILLYLLPREQARWIQQNQTLLSIIFLVLLVSGFLGPFLIPVLSFFDALHFGLPRLLWGAGVT